MEKLIAVLVPANVEIGMVKLWGEGVSGWLQHAVYQKTISIKLKN